MRNLVVKLITIREIKVTRIKMLTGMVITEEKMDMIRVFSTKKG